MTASNTIVLYFHAMSFPVTLCKLTAMALISQNIEKVVANCTFDGVDEVDIIA